MENQKETTFDQQNELQLAAEQQGSCHSSGRTGVDWQEKYKRLAADFDNYKKRIAAEQSKLEKQLQEKLLKKVLSLYDDFVRLHNNADHNDGLQQGVRAIYKKWQKWLLDHELEVMHPEGEEFDPVFHEAVLQQAVSDPKLHGKITEVIEVGYMRGDLMLRPAKVAVGHHEKEKDERIEISEIPLERKR